MILSLAITGLAIGSVYALVAMGFALIYKSTSIINFAQGEFVLVGGYVALWLYTDIRHLVFMVIGAAYPDLFTIMPEAGWQLLVVAIAFGLTIVAGVLMVLVLERLILRPMIGEPIISVIMVTIALATVLKGLGDHADMGAPRSATSIRRSSDQKAGLDLGVIEAAFGGPVDIHFRGHVPDHLSPLFFKFTRVGMAMRAVAADQQVAQSMGISVKTVFAISWSIGALVAHGGRHAGGQHKRHEHRP